MGFKYVKMLPNIEGTELPSKARFSPNFLDALKQIASGNLPGENINVKLLAAIPGKKTVLVLNPGKITSLECVKAEKDNGYSLFPEGLEVISCIKNKLFVFTVCYRNNDDSRERYYTAQMFDPIQGRVGDIVKANAITEAMQKFYPDWKGRKGGGIQETGLGSLACGTNEQLSNFFQANPHLILPETGLTISNFDEYAQKARLKTLQMKETARIKRNKVNRSKDQAAITSTTKAPAAAVAAAAPMPLPLPPYFGVPSYFFSQYSQAGVPNFLPQPPVSNLSVEVTAAQGNTFNLTNSGQTGSLNVDSNTDELHVSVSQRLSEEETPNVKRPRFDRLG